MAETFAQKFAAYGKQIPVIFHDGSDAEVAQIAVNIKKLQDLVADLRVIHDANFDLIAVGNQPARGTTVSRMYKLNKNAVTPAAPVVVENDPLAGEF